MLLFLLILGIVYAYEWLSGALEWESSIDFEESGHE
jgi:NADH:ubiquinone oxidoreductase subunit 3 (subunit A)